MAEMEMLIADLFGSDEEQAQEAVNALPAFGRHAVNALTRSLTVHKGTEPGMVTARVWTFRALAEIEDARVPALLEFGLYDEDPHVRRTAVQGLMKHLDVGAVPALIAHLEDEDMETAALAAETLALIGRPAVPALIETLAGESQAGRRRAVQSLGKIGDRRSLRALEGLVDDPDPQVARLAREGLQRTAG